MKPTIFVPGGAGYIGSHVVKELVERQYPVVVYDRRPLPAGLQSFAANGSLHSVTADLADQKTLADTLRKFAPAAAINFASDIAVGESVENPAKYYDNNIINGITLLDALREHGVELLVFSSSAAVYGMPQVVPIPEDHPTAPISPYGRTKWMFEYILRDYGQAYGMRSIALRYFNAAGADMSGTLGEAHEPETHLVPLILQVPLGKREQVQIYGTDYDTIDGTCIRDYIHVTDLAMAHILAVEALLAGHQTDVFNLGNGSGHTVRQVIAAAEKVVGKPIAFTEAERRAGDPGALVASSQKAMTQLGWKPKYYEIETIIKSAWAWHNRDAS